MVLLFERFQHFFRLIEIDHDGYVNLTKSGIEAYDELVQWIMKYVCQLKFPRLRLKT